MKERERGEDTEGYNEWEGERGTIVTPGNFHLFW